MNLDEMKALAARVATDSATLSRALATYTPPTPPAALPPVLTVASGRPTIPAGALDIERMKALFPAAAKQHGKDLGFWANDSKMIELRGGGRFRVGLRRDDWARIPNAAIPLDRPVTAARISYKIHFGPDGLPWHWGGSGKIPGLACHKEGMFPGGGRIGARNWSASLAFGWKAGRTQIGLGPYVYSQHKPAVADAGWSPDYPDGTLRWGLPTIPGLVAGGEHLIEIDHEPAPGPGMGRITFRVDGRQCWQETMQMVAPGQPHLVTHVHFRIMYGGDTLETYWPPASVPVSTLDIWDLKVEELPS